ncbi:MAG: heme NO-binding domain-containing protein [Deltaproteobacteria bacterium]|nr:heme NO-binding domain-containing protein [Deltaproteobacteria bacterium]
MKGHIFQLFEIFVKEKHGEMVLDELYNETSIPENVIPFLKPLTYPDEYLLGMISALSSKTGLSVDQIVYDYGKHLVPGLLEMYPQLIKSIHSTSGILKRVEHIHVTEIMKLYPDATPPDIKLKEWDESKQEGVLTYCSPRHLCRLVDGVLDGLADRYKEKITYHQTHCMNKGDKECVYKISIIK